MSSSSACSNPTGSTGAGVVAAALRSDVGCTTIASNALVYSHEISEAVGSTIAANAHIYGPFEAGFSSSQDSIIAGWGCSPSSLAYDTAGGLDLGIATAKVAAVCGVTLPSISGTKYTGLTGSCGGHTGNYHFHGGFECFEDASGTHSPKVGVAGSYNVYGRFEDQDAGKYPLLDACGAHFGYTPESPSTSVYHYHIQRDAPFTIGCHGPSSSPAYGGLVTVAECRALYSECSGSTSSLTFGGSTYTYMRDCPCFDANGLNYGTPTELYAIGNYSSTPSSWVKSYDVSDWKCRAPYGGCIPTIAEILAAGTTTTSLAAVTKVSLITMLATAALAVLA